MPAVKNKPKKKKRPSRCVKEPAVTPPQWLTVQQAADMLQVTAQTVRVMNDGDLEFPRFYKVGKRGYRLLLSDLIAYMEKHKQVGNNPV